MPRTRDPLAGFVPYMTGPQGLTHARDISVTITRNGTLDLAPEAVAVLGGPGTYVRLYHNLRTRQLALKPTTEDDPNGLPILQEGDLFVVKARHVLQHWHYLQAQPRVRQIAELRAQQVVVFSLRPQAGDEHAATPDRHESDTPVATPG